MSTLRVAVPADQTLDLVASIKVSRVCAEATDTILVTGASGVIGSRLVAPIARATAEADRGRSGAA